MDPSSSNNNDGCGGDLSLPLRPPSELNFDGAKEILSSFIRDHLLSIVQSALSSFNFPVLSSIQNITDDSDPSFRRLSVTGLGPDATDSSLRDSFAQFGHVEEAAVIAAGGAARVGYVTFQHAAAAIFAVRSLEELTINGRPVRAALAGPPFPPASLRSVLVQNVSPSFPPDRLVEFFSSYGEIERGQLWFQTVGGKFQGRATFVYKAEDGATKAVEEPMKTIGRHVLMCKLAGNEPLKTSS